MDNKNLKIKNFSYRLVAQSSPTVSTETQNEHMEQHENVGMSDNVGQNVLALSVNFKNSVTQRQTQLGGELKDFFKRPVQILSFTWQVGTSFAPFTIFPWTRYLQNPAVLLKLQNFKLIHGTLHLKFILNGSPFHYGRAFVGVYPYHTTNNTYNALPGTLVNSSNYFSGAAATSVRPMNTFYSQRPHVLLNPAKNESATIKWPFFSMTDWLNINETTANDFLDSDRCGMLEFWDLVNVQHANNADTPVEISVLAWMEDVEVAGLTTVLPAQSDKMNIMMSNEDDKLCEGAQYGTMVMPRMVRGAYQLGFAKHLLNNSNEYMSQNYYGNVVNNDGPDVAVKLSLDSKQELTLDPTTVGLNKDDEMSIMNIAKREAIFHQEAWLPTETNGTILTQFLVTPWLSPELLPFSSQPFAKVMTPIALTASTFEQWTGSIRIRIQVVISQMHSGRLLIIYDPSDNGFPTINDLNVGFSHIMDIGQENDVTFEINWSQPEAFKDVATFGPILYSKPLATPFGGAYEFCNGMIRVIVLNKIVSPLGESAPPVIINYWISAGDSFRLNNPKGINTTKYTSTGGTFPLPAQSGMMTQIAPTKEEDKPYQSTDYILNGSYDNGYNDLHKVYFGEHIPSIRNLLRRYTPYAAACYGGFPGVSTIWRSDAINMTQFPSGRADDPGAFYGSSTPLPSIMVPTTTINGALQTYIRHFAQAYIGYRGAIRWKIIGSGVPERTTLSVSRRPRVSTQSSNTIATIADSSSLTDRVFANFNTMSQIAAGGTHIVDANLGRGINVEMPFQSVYRFAPIHHIFGDDLYANPNEQQLRIVTQVAPDSATSQFSLQFWCAVGDDFQFLFFVGAPPIFGL